MTGSLSNLAIRELSVILPSPPEEAFRPHIRVTNIRSSVADLAQPRTPNAETVEVLRQTERGEDIIQFNNLDELIADCEAYAESSTD